MAAADVLRALLDERGWRPVDLADRMEKLRPNTRSEHHKIAVYRWLKGAGIAPESAQLLAEVFGNDPAGWLPAPISTFEYAQLRAELDELRAELESVRRREAEAHQHASELVQQLGRMERLIQRPLELPRPASQRRETG